MAFGRNMDGLSKNFGRATGPCDSYGYAVGGKAAASAAEKCAT
jgi:hypothetical protein